MGFFSFLGEVASAAAKELKESTDKYKKAQSDYQGYSDDRLKDIYGSSWSSFTEKAAAAKILKERKTRNDRDY